MPLAPDFRSTASGQAASVPGVRLLRRRRRRAQLAVLALVVILVLVAAVAVTYRVGERRASARYPVTAIALAQARKALTGLPRTSSPAPDDYDREAFGPSWADVDHNGCDTRNDILARDLTDVRYSAGTHDCVVIAGLLQDPYTGQTLTFQRGKHSAEVQIDHVVALANAWRSGAAAWDAAERRLFANDPENLLAVDGSANQQKSAADAASWLPENTGYRCIYAIRQVTVKDKYRLTVTSPELAALSQALDRCTVASVHPSR